MKTDTKNAAQLMEKEACTVVLCSGKQTYKSKKRGVQPLLELLDAQARTEGSCAADRVVGSAAAFLYTLLKPAEVYAPVMSERAAAILKAADIAPYFDACVPVIYNRQNTGICPMEDAVRECTDAAEALDAIRKRLGELSKRV